MRKLVIQEWVSLDGFATDKENKLNFFASTVQDVYKDEYYMKWLKDIDCILFGKNTFKQFSAVWPERNGDMISEKINTSEKIVFSKSLTNAPWGKWAPAKIVSTGIQSKIKELKLRPGKNIMIWGSLSLVQLAMVDQLIDEYQINISPIMTGGGRRLLTDVNPKVLNLVHSKTFNSGVVSLHYKLSTN
jgi:dihydrofolate reductase